MGAAVVGATGLGITGVGAPSAFANGAWGGYANGYIPLADLDVIDYPGVIPYQYSSDALSQVYLAPGCSDRLLALLAAYHAAKGGYLRVSEGYRTYAGQEWLAANDNGGTPGQSNHGWAQAVDFDSGLLTSAQAIWLNANGPSYHFHPLAGDYGHYNYTGPITPPNEPDGDIEMRILFNTSDPNDATRRATVGELTFDVISSAESTPERRLWGVPVNVTQAEWNTILSLVNARRASNGLAPL
jgi:hypothetical protein